MQEIKIQTTMLPVSVNNLYKRKRGGGVYKNPDALVFERLLLYENFKNKPKKPLNKKLEITKAIFTFANKTKLASSDLDNLLKNTLDSLEKGGFIKNDKLIYKIKNQEKKLGDQDHTFLIIREVE